MERYKYYIITSIRKTYKKNLLFTKVFLGFFFVLLFSVLIPHHNHSIEQKALPLVKGIEAKQIPSLPGEPIKWVALVPASAISSNQHLIKIPRLAEKVKVTPVGNSYKINTELSKIKVSTSTISRQYRLKLSKISKENAKSPESLALKQSLAKQNKIKNKRASLQGLFVHFIDSIQGILSKIGGSTASADTDVAEISIPSTPTDSQVQLIDLAPTVTSITTPSVIENKASVNEAIDNQQNIIDSATTTIINTNTDTNTVTTTSATPSTTDATTTIATPTITTITTTTSATDTTSTITTNSTTIATSTATTTYVLVEYQTPAPTIAEATTSNGKMVTVSDNAGDAEGQPHTTDVLAFTNIPEIYKVGQESKIKIKWKNNNNQDVEFHAYDLDGNGKLDYMEWTVPHLSTQTFEIIFISKAFRLDENKQIIGDIYDAVATQDNNWATIQNNKWLRFTFEAPVDNTKNIDIYVKPTNYNYPAKIEIYRENSDQLIATFNVDKEDYYHILMTNLGDNPTDVFDFKIINGADIDYVQDAINLVTISSASDIGGSWSGGSPNTFTCGVASVINTGTLTTKLNASSVIINCNGSIVINSAISWTTAGNTLTMSDTHASNALSVNNNITGPGGVTLTSSGTGGIKIGGAGNGTVTIDTSSGNGNFQTSSNIQDVGTTHSLAINTGSGAVTLSSVGQSAAISSLNVTTTGTTTLNGSVQTNGAGGVNFSGTGTIILGASININTTSGNGPVNFGGTIDGNSSLSISSSGGATTFSGVIGNSVPIASLSVSSASVNINTTAITLASGFSPTFNGPVTLGTSTTITTSGSNNINFNSTINGAYNLSVNANASGTIAFSGIVGGGTALGSIMINCSSATFSSTINSGSYTNTAGNVTMTDNVVLTGGLTIASGTLIAPTTGKSISLTGNWSNSGNFTARNGTIAFNGTNQTITGNTVFNIVGGSSTIPSVASGINISTNNANISTNNANISTNNGIIATNGVLGTIGTNNGTVTNNLGSISINNGTINTNTFTLGGYNGPSGVITGDATFSYLTATSGVAIDTTGYANGAVGGVTKDSAGSTISTWTFNNTNNNGKVTGNAIFNNNTNNAGTINGNVVFNGSSTNSGIIMHNVDVYSPVHRPIGGTIYGLIAYHGYSGFYFNDKALGAAGDGNWDNPLNWWSNVAFTIHAGDIPRAGDEVYIYSDIATTTSNSASIASITFENGSKNHIHINIAGDVVFNATSTNSANGSITAGVITFMGNLTDNLGLVTGTLVRTFTESVTTNRNFTTEGERNDWIIIARGVVVDISGAIYNTATNIFKALNGGLFTSNPLISGGASVVPNIISTLPVQNQIVIKWLPIVNWDNSVTCQYSYDNWITTKTSTCSATSTDIERPQAGPQILSLRGIDSLGNIAEKNILFTYDNTSPVWTSCGTDLLDEATRSYYYLQNGTVIGDCHLRVSTELRGSLAGIGPSAGTLTGQVISDATSTSGYNITLKNITVTGTTTSAGLGSGKNGGNIIVENSATNALISNGAGGSTGGGAGSITVSTSTTGSIFANGASGTANGGNGGDVTVWNSDGSATSTAVTSNGGNSTGCGNGGNTGAINITNSNNYEATAIAGVGSNTTCTSESHFGGQIISPPVVTYRPVISSPSANSNSQGRGGNSGGSYVGDYFFSLNNIGRLNLANLPNVGLNLNSNLGVSNLVNPLAGLFKINPVSNLSPIPKIDFTNNLKNFISNANVLPNALVNLSKEVPSIKKELNKAGIINGYDLYSMKESPIKTPTLAELLKAKVARPDNLLFVSIDGMEKSTKLSIDKKGNLYQIIEVEPENYIYVSVKNTKKNIKADFNGENVAILKDKNGIIKVVVPSPSEVGTYTLKVGELILEVRVKKTVLPEKIQSATSTDEVYVQQTNQKPNSNKGLLSPIKKIWSLFGK